MEDQNQVQENPITEEVESNFSFRSKDGYKRPTVSVKYQAANANGIVQLLHGDDEKVRSLIVDTVQGVLASHIRTYVDNDLDFNQETLDGLIKEGKISLTTIANLPRADRNMLTKDDLENFAKSYIKVMVAATGKDEKKVEAAANLFVARFKTVSGDNDVLKFLQSQLDVYLENAGEAAEEHERAIAYFSNKLEELISVKVSVEDLE